jgi:hypothetical protein
MITNLKKTRLSLIKISLTMVRTEQRFMQQADNKFILFSFCFADLLTSTTAPSTTSSTTAPSVDYVSQASTQAPEKPSEIPISAPNDGPGTSIPTPDPYFTHFDPRMEHQSYKVGLDVKNIIEYSHFID